ncbi:MAG: hypothetical protein AAFW73_17220 [Bacteroidota bacterium]
MSYFQQQYQRLQTHFLERKVTRTPIQRVPGDYASARKIGLLFDATDPERRPIVLQYAQSLKQKNKEVKLLAFYDAKQAQPNFTFKHFTQKELNFWRHPSGSLVEDFIAQPFDILINLFFDAQAPLEYITALSRAQLRVGPYSERTYCYDLMIENQSPDLPRFIKQVEFLLNKMNNSTPHETTSV